ncbi:hypothetical protein NEOLEDRAFT_1182190 [Neolentinus lepideus HHB14362 ss-1]|uniref:Uncharacterized protein n=1 Tax=Neolentinus lepideus HHB14362 ss-1 TaxID=1314782 RepID=A0A165PD35_9AGAM|nr:hypothetical protein NEOLEDRAFT_1182190 [Neolentinus lepideus HHB14362 ss-1]
MDVVPPELLSHIISFSTLDGGETGQSLLLTSKTVYALTLPFLLQSLSCSGLSSIQRLTSTLQLLKERAEREGRKYIPPVKHLFLCDVSGKNASDVDAALPVPPEPENASEESADIAKKDPVQGEVHALLVAYTELFELLGPSLESLTFLAYNRHITPYRIIIDTPLPRLRYLSMRFTALPYLSVHIPRVLPNGEEEPETSQQALPELTHLHLGFASKPKLSEEPFGLLRLTCDQAPNLSHVKLTNVQFSDDCAQTLRKSLRLGRLFKSLQTPGTPSLVDIEDSEFGESDMSTLQGEADTASNAADDASTDVDEEEDLPESPFANFAGMYIQPAKCGLDNIVHLEALGDLQILAYVSRSQWQSLGARPHVEEQKRRPELHVLPTATTGEYVQWKERWTAEIASIPNLGIVYGERETEEDLLA